MFQWHSRANLAAMVCALTALSGGSTRAQDKEEAPVLKARVAIAVAAKQDEKVEEKKADEKKDEKKAEEKPDAEVVTVAPRTNEVEVKIADGSTVRMVVVQETVNVATRYGNLVVPTKEIRKIEFGLRLPEDVGKRIDAAIKKFAGEAFEDREAATNELVSIGSAAYPALRDASENSDAEVAARARSAMKKIREKVPASQLQTTMNDKLETGLFTVVGRVTSPTVKATGYFGTVDLKIADLRSIRWMSANTVVDLTIDANKYGGGNNQWLDTKVLIEPDVPLRITASGIVNLNEQGGGGDFTTGPNGNNNWGRRGPHAPGALLGRIGEKGKVFVVGERYEATPNEEGTLQLQISPSPWNQSTGSFKVKIISGRSIEK